MGELVVWSAKNIKYNPFQQPYRDFLLLGRLRRILQKPGQAIGSVVWDAAFVMCKYFEDHMKEQFKSKKVLELGSGTGIVGIVASLMGSEVILTDQKEILEYITMNVDINVTNDESLKIYTVPGTEFRREFVNHLPIIAELKWGENLTEFKEKYKDHLPFDYIIGSDIIYEPVAFEPLVNTLKELTTGSFSSTEIILGYKHRYLREGHFFELLEKHFDVIKVPPNKLPAEFTESTSPISIFHVKRKKDDV